VPPPQPASSNAMTSRALTLPAYPATRAVTARLHTAAVLPCPRADLLRTVQARCGHRRRSVGDAGR
jgi:hypothetical protein